MKRKATAYPERLCLPSLSTSSSSSLTARSVPDSIDGYSSNTSRSILSRSESTAGRHGLQSAKSVQSIQTEPEQDRIVGTLTGVVRGEQVVIYIHSTSSYTVIGSDATCNVRLWDQDVSRKHMRIYSIRTDSALMVTCLHDISVNGFTINGSRFRSRTPISVGQRKVYTQAAILMDGDVLRFAGTSYQFVYEHNFQDFPLPCHSASPIEEFGQLPDPIFGPNDDPRDKYDAHPWIIHNYQLGSGAYAYVNLASHKAGGLQVACKTVKMLTEEVDEEEETSDGDSLQSWTTEGSSSTKRKKDVQAYLEEVKTLRVLCHPNVAALLDVIHDPEQSRVHVFMELVTGGDLFSHLERSTLTEGEVAFLAYQLCKGIGYLHELRLAHRDIKPENILLAVSDAYPKVVITDFGHAISETQLLELIPLNPDEFCARIYPVTGTIEYLPRERLIALLRPPRGVQGTLEEVGIGWAEKRNQIAGKWLEEEFALDSWALGCESTAVVTPN
ncbi:kinase-like domain-containing protein [Kockovaella imperatae]|uniref:Kinase-like domain-containing protein n=1 Tax=Kockovaella imperatae TaxID=4999 RepID=A0A1Y1UEC9_9TREE|nr:kinase-like domain-containing protein [Kockovaella imperatae]ORX35887.1 kinase-like domain-containing protein [Kockovaella imperatae]